MPKGNGTGPTGMGALTGRRAGYCAGFSAPGYDTPGYGQLAGRVYGLFGRGNRMGMRGAWEGGRAGFGAGFGGHRFFGVGRKFRGYRQDPYGGPHPPYSYPPHDPEVEKEALSVHAEELQTELDAVKKRMNEIDETERPMNERPENQGSERQGSKKEGSESRGQNYQGPEKGFGKGSEI